MQRIAVVLIFFTTFIITANMHMYIHSLRLGIYSWQIFVPVIPIQLFLVAALGNWKRLDSPTIQYMTWWALLLVTMALSFVFVQDSQKAYGIFVQYITIATISLTFLAVVQQPILVKSAAYAITAACVIAAGVSFIEFMNPDFNMIVDQRYESKAKDGVVGRVGGLYQNPNNNARLMTLGMFVSAFFIPQRYRMPLCIFVGCAVFTTLSRSGMLTWGLAMMLLSMLGQFAPGKIAAKIAGIGTVALLASALTLGLIPVFLEKTGLDEFMTPSMIERVSTSFFEQADGSTESRDILLSAGLELYSNNAFTGTGLGGSTDLADTGLGPHNTPLEIAIELGTIGLLIYMSMVLIPLGKKSVKGLAFVGLFTVSSLFSHGLLDYPSLAFILPAGIVLLSRLDAKSNLKSKRRKRRRRSNSVIPKHKSLNPTPLHR